jgi:multidrug efflux system outer membrane protein
MQIRKFSAARLTSPLALTAALLAAGCTMAPHYERPAAPVAASFPSGAAYQAPAAGQPGGTVAAADLGWREFLGDPQLQALVEIALRNNRDLRVAVLNIEVSRAQYRIERAALFPSVTASGAQSRSRIPAGVFSPTSTTGSGTTTTTAVTGTISRGTITNVYSAGLSAQWELDFFGHLQSLKNQALYQYLSTAQARKATEILLVSEVATQYLTMRSDDEALKVTLDTLHSAQESYRLAKAQFDAGTGTELSLRQAETVVDQAQANYQAQLRARAQAENALVLLIGEPMPADLPAPLPLDDQRILSDIPAGLPSDLLTRRPDIIEAENTLLANNANIGAARAAFFPTITITGTGGTESPTLGGLFKAGTGSWSFAPDITLPIFNAGSLLASLDIAKTQKKIAVAQYEKAIQTAFREVADGLAARGTYDNQIVALQKDAYANQRSLDLSQLRFTSGVDSYLPVLTAQTSLYSAQLTLIQARLERLTNLVNLYQYLGGGWLEHTGDKGRDADAPQTADVPAAKS